MKLWIDAQLSPGIAVWITSTFVLLRLGEKVVEIREA